MKTITEIAGIIDNTLLMPNITFAQIENLCNESTLYNFKSVAINNALISTCKKLLENSKVLIDAAIGFPLGQSTLETKIFETEDAIDKGADEIDYVINIHELKKGNIKYIRQEMDSIVNICRKKNITSKVIFENCYLTDDEKKSLCAVALSVLPDFVKTSTGFGSYGSTIHDIELMKSCVSNKIKIKAAGGIRTIKDFKEAIKAGANRIGTSKGVQIINEYKNKIRKDIPIQL